MTKKNHDGDVAFIRALAELLKENDLTELEVNREYGEDDSLNVRVSRAMAAAPLAAPMAVSAAPAAAPVAPPAAEAPAPVQSDDPAAHPGAVTSPMVGTAYMQSEPGAPAFVSQGKQVKEGETILIIEAMKTMNQIPAPRSGTVTRIFVDDGAPVEYGAVLMIIE
ncbi:MAG: acetyl-CoA carboxylase biotin carboxyl carrier protein [Pseudomonadota bacterium]